ncbi:MAG: cupredoxin domain-containing protein [Candidatus Levybacteria bacterium]|nr:cupredoxin domain-containing protein [Candidatus Levybacteria bacterium]
MAKKRVSKTAKKKVHHTSHTDDHSFLIIAGGGFVIISIIMLFLYNQPSSTEKMMYETANTITSEDQRVVSMNDSMFTPESLTVKVGESVTWRNDGMTDHNIVSDDDVFTTGVLAKGEEGSYTFTKEGTYSYHCSIHPEMTGTIVVE